MSSRVPDCRDYTFDGMLQWFAAMSLRGFLFHPDGDPAEIISISDSAAIFNAEEVGQLRNILGCMFEKNRYAVYEAAYPAFMKRMGIRWMRNG